MIVSQQLIGAVFLLLIAIVSTPVNGFLTTTNRRQHHGSINRHSPKLYDTNPKQNDDDERQHHQPATTPNIPNYPNRMTVPQPSAASSHPHRSGFLSLIGAPNMGKSTLLNALLSQTLCTVTPRPQTTRHAILGVLTSTEPDLPCQLCFWDTPGVIGDPAYRLQEGMMEAVKGAFVDSDVILVVTDLFGTVIPDDVMFQKLVQTDRKIIVAVNKVDLAERVGEDDPEEATVDEAELRYKRTVRISSAVQKWRKLLPQAIAVIPLTASNGGDDPGVVALRTLLLGGKDVPKAFRDLGRPVEGMFPDGKRTITDEEALGIIPEGPPLYGEDALTDRSERFFASEIIRAALFLNLGKEIPYCCEVRIAQFREPKPYDRKQVTRITADICVERISQKGIVVGKGGEKIRAVGVDARKELEDFLQGKVHLSLNVKVDKNWRRDEDKLKAYGYLK